MVFFMFFLFYPRYYILSDYTNNIHNIIYKDNLPSFKLTRASADVPVIIHNIMNIFTSSLIFNFQLATEYSRSLLLTTPNINFLYRTFGLVNNECLPDWIKLYRTLSDRPAYFARSAIIGHWNSTKQVCKRENSKLFTF